MNVLGYDFLHPYRLYLLLLLIPLIAWYVWRNWDKWASLKFSTAEPFARGRSFKQYLLHLLFVSEALAFALLIIAFARPRKSYTNRTVSTQGIDIVLAIDISPSMLAEDFTPNRMEAAKNEAIKFVNGRPNDRIGVVAFGGESFTLVPLTLDHATVINMIRKLRNGMVDNGTAIGLGIANAVARLKSSKAKSKVIILLTDGVNNRGNIDPITAAKMAAMYGIRIYTIGIGSETYANIPVQTPFGTEYQKVKVEIDEATLKQIADITGGKYFRATNNKKLADIYKQIDRLEKTKFKEKRQVYYAEMYWDFVLIAFILLLLDVLLRNTLLRTFP